ncbi:MAG: glycosyltransferase family 4 protein [Desulfosarcina sp.]
MKAIPILILDNSFTFGGAINSLKHLLNALDTKRFVPVLVTGQSREFLANHFDCTCYHYVPKLPWVNNRIYKRIASLSIFRIRFLLKTLKLLRFVYWFAFITVPEALRYYRIGRKHRVSLVHLNNTFDSQLAGIIAARLLRVPCVGHLRDFVEVHPITRLYARLVDHHVAISGAIRENLLDLGVPDQRVTVVHDAIDLDEFNADGDCAGLLREFGLTPGQPVFGIFGRVVEWKGIREFVLAARQVIDNIPDACGFVVGGPSDGDDSFFWTMKHLAAGLGLENKVFFTGYRRDVPALMGMMNVIVHSSIRPEPFGMVLIEGMAMKKPVVASRGGGPLDIVIEGETGFLVEMGDSRAMSEAIIYLLNHPALRKKMGLVGRHRVVRDFASPRYADQMERIFQLLLATTHKV